MQPSPTRHQPDNCQLIRQLWSHPSCVSSSPPPTLSHKPVTPLRHRTGVTFSFCAVYVCAFPLHFHFYQVKLKKHARNFSFPSFFWCLNHYLCQPFTSSCILLFPTWLTFSCLTLKIITVSCGGSSCKPRG